MKILIRNGRIIDPAQAIDSRLDLLTEGRSIRGVGIPGAFDHSGWDEAIDASGQVVCPGFIDIHMHEDPIGEDGRIAPCIFPAMLRMGVTSVLAGNCGLNEIHPVDYLDHVDREGCAVNVGMLAGHRYFREAAGVTDRYSPAGPEQVEEMKKQISRALKDGCIGISFGLRYVPGATTEEFLQAASCAAPEKRLVSAHVRDDAAYVFDAVEEFVRAGRTYGVPLQVSHIGSMGGYGQMERLLQQMDACRAEGMDIQADCYPYNAFCTGIGEATYDDGWRERYHCGYDAVELCEGPYRGQRCDRRIFDEMRRSSPEALTVCHVMREEDVDAAFRHPYVCVGSDGTLSGGQGHPRAAGAFPRFLAVYVREKKLLSLYEAVERMSTRSAGRMGLEKKGNLRPGSDADIVVFNPETVRDRATFAEPMLAPEGISRVLVGGRVAVKDGQILTGRAGRSIRRFSPGMPGQSS